jgi:DNA adenine methylase
MYRLIPSPLRYPGGKSRAVPLIVRLVPDYVEFREPMVGGGSVFLALRQLRPKARYWINDLNKDLFSLWVSIRDGAFSMMQMVHDIRERYKNPRDLFLHLRDWEAKSTLERAVRYFILNRIGFSGLVDTGGTFSESAYYKLFSSAVIRRIGQLSPLLEGVRITNEDYSVLLHEPGEGVFIFLDPPYVTAGGYLYGKGGKLHEQFNHERFAQECRKCPHRWLITYDDCDLVRNLFVGYEQVSWRLQYGMNNAGGNRARQGDELFIANYSISHLVPHQPVLDL